MAPAQQRLGAADDAGLQVHLGLVVQLELLGLSAPGAGRFPAAAGSCAVSPMLARNAQRPLPCLLGVVHGGIGMGQQQFGTRRHRADTAPRRSWPKRGCRCRRCAWARPAPPVRAATRPRPPPRRPANSARTRTRRRPAAPAYRPRARSPPAAARSPAGTGHRHGGPWNR